jgi:uncharacterized protein (TIGR00251 family)
MAASRASVSGDPAFLRRAAGGVTVELRVQPRARRTGVEDGDVLKVLVSAPAEDGKANAAVIELLAREWRLPKSAFAIVRGTAARQKVVAIAGDPADLERRIAAWRKERAGNDD